MGRARDDAELRDNMRCVLNSASTMRGNVTTNVVNRHLPTEVDSVIESATMRALIDRLLIDCLFLLLVQELNAITDDRVIRYYRDS